MDIRRQVIRRILCSGLNLYHLSPVKFSNFKQQKSRLRVGMHADVGFHLGTKETAFNASELLRHRGRLKSGDTVYLYEVDFNPRRVLNLKEGRGGTWSIHDLLRRMFEAEPQFDFLSDEEINDYYEDIIMSPNGENLKDLTWDPDLERSEFTDWIKSKGIDGIQYRNTFEGGGISYLAFDPQTIKIKKVIPYTIS